MNKHIEGGILVKVNTVTMAGAGSLSDLVLPLLNFLRQLCIFPYIKTLLGTEVSNVDIC